MRSRFSAIVMVLSALLGSEAMRGCSCAEMPPPCESIGRSPMVFTGTVLDITEQGFKLARMRVDRVYKGSLPKQVELFDDGMCDGPHLEIGRQYLMYTHRYPNGGIPARGCTRSRAIEFADEDLRFLNAYAAGKTKSFVSGTVRFRPDEPEDSELGEEGRTPMKDVQVTLRHGDRHYKARTDASGRFTISDLPPGDYQIRTNLSGYRANWEPEEIAVVQRGCATANILMAVDRRVEGYVRNADGDPVSGIMVEMALSRPRRRGGPFLLAITGKDGRYVIDGIPPGEYHLGINIWSTPTMEQPYPTLYYPNTTDIAQALPMSFMSGAAVQTYDLIAPARLRILKIKARVVGSDGKPPTVRTHIRIKEPGLYGQVEAGSLTIQPDGRFEMLLCEGVRYSAFAFTGSTYSAPVEFIASERDDEMLFVLDKSAAEFQVLRRKLDRQ